MSENENDFEALRRLLVLKRHEIPPPGYFEDFSSRVIGRIRASEAARELPWLLRLLQAFEAKPAYPVAFASALCTLLLFGIVSVEQSPVLASNSIYPSSSPDFSFVPRAQDPPLAVLTSSNSAPADVNLFGGSVNSSVYSPQTAGFDAN
jgi:hypothetical protein